MGEGAIYIQYVPSLKLLNQSQFMFSSFIDFSRRLSWLCVCANERKSNFTTWGLFFFQKVNSSAGIFILFLLQECKTDTHLVSLTHTMWCLESEVQFYSPSMLYNNGFSQVLVHIFVYLLTFLQYTHTNTHSHMHTFANMWYIRLSSESEWHIPPATNLRGDHTSPMCSSIPVCVYLWAYL